MLLDQGGRRTSRKIDLAHWLGTTDGSKRSEIAICEDSERRCICTDAVSNVGEVTFFCMQLGDDLRVETGDLVCVFMQADTSCEMCARPPKGQEKDGWIWRVHGAMNGERHTGIPGCLFVHDSNGTRVVSHLAHLRKTCNIGKILDSHCRR